MGKAIGIDLGTSECCVYAAVDGGVELVPSRTGRPTTPAWLAVVDDGEILLGQAAMRQAVVNPTRTIFGLKRLIGRKFHSPAVRWLEALCPWSIVPAYNGDAWVKLDGEPQSPQALLAHLLADLRAQAQAHLRDVVDEAVVAVPASFDLNQRRAVMEAARIAELEIRELIAEPDAAALAYVQSYPSRGAFALADLGGGFFDVALYRHHDDTLEVVAASGDGLLGGQDFDRRLVELLINAFYEQKSVDLAEDPTALQRLWEACRLSKRELSAAPVANPIDLPHIAKVDGKPVRLHHAGLGRELLETLGQEELERLAGPCAWVFEDSALGTDDFEEVVLVGGASRVVAVEEALAFLFRRRPRPLAQPEQIVAQGAAHRAAALRGEISAPRLLPVASHSLGIKTRGGRFRALIERNQRLPASHQRRFTPATDGSGQLVFELYQGEAELVNDNIYVGRIALTGVTGQVDVTSTLDESSLLSLEAEDSETRRSIPIPMQPAGGLDDDRVAALAAGRRPVSLEPPSAERPPSVKKQSPEAPPVLTASVDEAVTDVDPSEAFASLRRRALADKERQAREAVTQPARARHHSIKPPAPRRAGPLSSLPAPPLGPLDVGVDSLVGATLGERYVVEGIIAEGGMGRVYRAHHKVLGRIFAIKLLHAELASNEDIASRFVREAQAASRIAHPHVVDISDFGRLEDGTGYFVMELLEGPTLAQLIAERKRLSITLSRDIGVQLADALSAAHALDIIHRDLKPDNVTLVERTGTKHFCKVVDFGIAKSPTSDSNHRTTLAGTLLGTPHYMAPEQIDSGTIDARTDIYALGAVLYEMVTGAPPFEADSIVNLLVAHKINPAPPPSVRAPGLAIPEAFESLILQCLEKAKDDRPASAEEVRARLQGLELD